jgi:hypothetical protein
VRQVCISEELLAGSCEDAVKSLKQWLDELENLINDLQASVAVPGFTPRGPGVVFDFRRGCKSGRCQAYNEAHGYDDRPDPLGRDAETAKRRYIVGRLPL